MPTTLVYNGIALQIIKTAPSMRRPVYDSLNVYLYTEITLVVNAIFNPQATAYAPANVPVPPPLAQVAPTLGFGPRALGLDSPWPVQSVLAMTPGTPPALTEVAVRHALAQSQRQLVYAVDGVEILRSPVKGARVDANNGPAVLEAPTVVEIIGSKSFRVQFTVRTWINECPSTRRRRGILLSHVWEQSEDLDQDYYSERTTTGRMTFDTSRLTAGNLTADDYRSFAFQPIPDGFKRERLRVVATEDGNQLAYTFVDRQQTLSITSPYAGIVSRIEAVHSVSSGLPDYVSAVFGNLGIGGAPAALEEAFRWAQTGAPPRGAPPVAYSSFGHAMLHRFARAIPLVGDSFAALVPPPPVTTHSVVVRVWGHQDAYIEDLSNAAYWVVLYRLSRTTPLAYAISLNESRDVMGRFIDLTVTYSGPGVSFEVLQTVGNQYPDVRGYFDLNFGHDHIPIRNYGVVQIVQATPGGPRPPDIFQLPQVNPIPRPPSFQANTAGGAVQQPPAHGDNTANFLANYNEIGMLPTNQNRGTFIGKIVAQMLQGPCSAPAILTVIPAAAGQLTDGTRLSSFQEAPPVP